MQLNRLLEDTTFKRRCAWSIVIGEVLVCRRDTRNHHDDPLPLLHVAKGTTVVGHILYIDKYLRFVSYIRMFFWDNPGLV